MSKDIWLKGRCSKVLKDRLQKYLEAQSKKGDTVKESEVIRKAVVEYLNRAEGQNPHPSSGSNPGPDAPLGAHVESVLRRASKARQ